MKKYIFLIVLVSCLSSCNNTLDENPKSIAAETFYNTANEIEGGVYAIYSPIMLYWQNAHRLLLRECISGYGWGKGSFASISNYGALDATNISRVNSLWYYLYQAIRNANLIIKNGPNASKATQNEISKLVAEAKFLRAHCYFELVTNWGAVPLRTEENMITSDVARTPITEVYNLIVSDLEYAEKNLPETQSIKGRPQQATAKTLLAHVYLLMERWSDARSKALEVINSKKYSLVNVSVSDDFYKIFGPDVNGSSEEIFYIKYEDVNGYGLHVPVFLAGAGTTYCNGSGYSAMYSDTILVKFMDNWDTKDLRKRFNIYHYDLGLKLPAQVNFKKFIYPKLTITNTSPTDWPVYRYADLLLFYAEADCRVNNGPTTDGMEKLNMIHRRAYGKDPNTATSMDFKLSDYDKNSFIDLVLKEDGYEHLMEGKHFLNMVRTGKYAGLINERMGINISENCILWPIPSIEYDYNGAIDPTTDQNPGY